MSDEQAPEQEQPKPSMINVTKCEAIMRGMDDFLSQHDVTVKEAEYIVFSLIKWMVVRDSVVLTRNTIAQEQEKERVQAATANSMLAQWIQSQNQPPKPNGDDK